MSGLIVGIDLAWAGKRPDAFCIVERDAQGGSRVTGFEQSLGDAEFLDLMRSLAGHDGRLFAAMDAPVVCPNENGARPVDRETQRLFRRQEAACHPCNLRLTPRPPRLANQLSGEGFTVGWDPSERRVLCEVYPHPAIVRWGGLERSLK